MARPLVHLAFAASGVAALLYQLIWQRALLGLYGTTAETVTIVVTTFLLGLGLGSLLGGAWGPRMERPLLAFVALETAVAGCGLVSIPVLQAVGRWSAGASMPVVWALAGGLLLTPTAMMGATLPVLSAAVSRATRQTGPAVAGLYAANTLGSAVAAILAVLVIVGPMGQRGTVWLAAIMNGVAAGLGCLAIALRGRATST